MTPFDEILQTAEARHGGAAALAERLPQPTSAEGLRAQPDDRYLSLMSLRVFSAGLKHSLVKGKWPAFEEVFMGFEPRRVRALSDESLEALMGDARIIRHWGKIKATRANAAAMCAVAEENGSFGAYLANWPGARIVELWDDLAKRFSHVGGNSGPYFLRMAGKDTFVLSGDVVKALNRWGAIDGTPKGKGDRKRVQEAFNAWVEATGRPLSQLSMILALSVD
jgi:3-methyladenine DNA glycosylase Tag